MLPGTMSLGVTVINDQFLHIGALKLSLYFKYSSLQSVEERIRLFVIRLQLQTPQDLYPFILSCQSTLYK